MLHTVQIRIGRSTMKHIALLLSVTFSSVMYAQETPAVVGKALAAVGGSEKLLAAFRMTELYNSGELPEPEGSPKRTPRTSVIIMPGRWEVGGRERGKEPAKDVVRAWALDLLVDPDSVIEPIAELTDENIRCTGLQISGSVTPAMKLYFDQQTHLLKRVDWRDDFYRFSDWRELDGLKYAARTSLFKLRDGKPWFHHEITGLERMQPEE